MTATARTFTARSARATRMRVLVIPTSPSQSPPGGRQSSPTWATPPWRTGIGRHAHSRQRHRRALGGDAENQGQGHRITTGDDKPYDTADHVANLRALNVTPHVTQNNGITKIGKSRRSAIDERTTRPQHYGMPQSRLPMIECIFG